MDDEKKRRLQRESRIALGRFLIYAIALPAGVFFLLFRKFNVDTDIEADVVIVLAFAGLAVFYWRQR